MVYARYAKEVLERKAAVGKTCEPREKYQRMRGREREAGWEASMGMSKREEEAMPPEATRETGMLRRCAGERVVMLGGF